MIVLLPKLDDLAVLNPRVFDDTAVSASVRPTAPGKGDVFDVFIGLDPKVWLSLALAPSFPVVIVLYYFLNIFCVVNGVILPNPSLFYWL